MKNSYSWIPLPFGRQSNANNHSSSRKVYVTSGQLIFKLLFRLNASTENLKRQRFDYNFKEFLMDLMIKEYKCVYTL